MPSSSFDTQPDAHSDTNRFIPDSWTPLHAHDINYSEFEEEYSNYFFILKTIAAVTITVCVVLLLWLCLPAVVASACSIVICTAAACSIYSFFNTNSRNNEKKSILDMEPVDPGSWMYNN